MVAVLSGMFVWGVICSVAGFFQEVVGTEQGTIPWELGRGEGIEAPVVAVASLEGWILTLWLITSLHRLGVVIIGSFRDPAVIVLQVPGIQGFVQVGRPPNRRGWIWLFLVVVLGLLHPAAAAAREKDALFEVVLRDGPECGMEAQGPRCVAPGDLVEEGSGWILDGMRYVIVIALWETLRRVWCRCCRKRTRVAETQATGINCVPLPLAEGMPNRARGRL